MRLGRINDARRTGRYGKRTKLHPKYVCVSRAARFDGRGRRLSSVERGNTGSQLYKKDQSHNSYNSEHTLHDQNAQSRINSWVGDKTAGSPLTSNKASHRVSCFHTARLVGHTLFFKMLGFTVKKYYTSHWIVACFRKLNKKNYKFFWRKFWFIAPQLALYVRTIQLTFVS